MQNFGVIFILGGPGAGKGTVCPQISQRYNVMHLSAGELLRKEMAETNSPFASEIEPYIKAGTIVPVEITCSLLYKAMLDGYEKHACKTYLIDGFPRNENNKAGWERAMSEKTNIIQVLTFDCPPELGIKRCLGRACGRLDDNEETLRQRIVQYKVEGLPVIDYYSAKNLVTHIDSSKTVEEVFEQVKSVLDPLLLHAK